MMHDDRDPAGTAGGELRLPTPAEAAAALPGLARIAGATWLNAAQWGVLATARNTRRLLRATRDPAVAAQLAHELGVTAAQVVDVARAVAGGVPVHEAVAAVAADGREAPAEHDDDPDASLRQRGAELLERSRDVWHEEAEHPAYGRILGDLAPDEARVLVLLVTSGPQPSVDVRTGGPVGKLNSQLIAPGLTMIGARAGCRYLDRVPAYLNNLHRLGLVWFSREQLMDPMEYQVLEAQPDVLAALHSQRFTRVVRRSIHLTPFGEDFCRAVLIESGDDRDFPAHQVPEDAGD